MQQSHTFASRYKPKHRQKLAKECACPTQVKEFQNIFPNASKKLKLYIHKPTMQTEDTCGHDNLTTETEAHAHNKVLPQWGLKCYYETEVHKRTFVSLINSGATIPPLRQYPNRYL